VLVDVLEFDDEVADPGNGLDVLASTTCSFFVRPDVICVHV